MAGMRDKLVHHYFGVNDDVVWVVATQEIPKLMPSLAEAYKSVTGEQEP